MPFRKTLLFGSQIVAVACLGIGYASVSGWAMLVVIACSLAAWLLAWKWPLLFPFSVALVISVCLAGAGLIAGALPLWMMLDVVLSLATWDLAQFDLVTRECEPSQSTTLMEKRHFLSLALALGLGLLAVITIQGIRFQIPFGVILLLVAVAFFCLDRLYRILEI